MKMSASCRNIETKTVTVNCSECGIEFEEEVDGFDNRTADDYCCSCCYEGSHRIDWDYGTATDNGCGDGCMIEGECSRCRKKLRAEFQQKSGEDPDEI